MNLNKTQRGQLRRFCLRMFRPRPDVYSYNDMSLFEILQIVTSGYELRYPLLDIGQSIGRHLLRNTQLGRQTRLAHRAKPVISRNE